MVRQVLAACVLALVALAAGADDTRPAGDPAVPERVMLLKELAAQQHAALGLSRDLVAVERELLSHAAAAEALGAKKKALEEAHARTQARVEELRQPLGRREGNRAGAADRRPEGEGRKSVPAADPGAKLDAILSRLDAMEKRLAELERSKK